MTEGFFEGDPCFLILADQRSDQSLRARGAKLVDADVKLTQSADFL